MTFNALLHFGAALFCVGLAFFGLFRDYRSFVHRIFAFGMVVLALESAFTGLSVQALFVKEVIFWQRWRWVATALLPGTWLLFNLSFPRGDDKPTPGTWKWIILAAFLLHLSFVTLFASRFFRDVPFFDPLQGWLISLGWSGYVFHISFMVGSVLIMMLLEKTLHASRGRQRWQVKFLALGLGALFAARVYTGSQALLLHELNLELEMVNGAALLVACFLILISIFRAHFLHMDIYLSQTMLYRSFTLLIVGVYLLAVGLLAKATGNVHNSLALAIRAFFIFLALLGLMMILFSDRLRLWMKQLISRHFRRPQYDYRKAWMAFTARTASLVERKAFCDAVAKMVSQMFDILSVSIWLLDEMREGLKMVGSTVFSEAQTKRLSGFPNRGADLIRLMRDRQAIVDLEDTETAEVEALGQSDMGFFEDARIRYCIPLVAGGDLLGFITLGDRVRGKLFSFEELEMLRTIADQVAATVMNLNLSEQLQQTKEMEAFQTLAALFVHDLKNLASKLSLLLQNLPAHFDNPAFRKDSLRAISQCVEKINGMCSRLSLVREGPELRPIEADLNELVTTTLFGLNGILKASLVEDLHPVPRVSLDPTQIPKVLTNLILNADAAVDEEEEIHVTTGTRDGWVVLTVRDNGCGMSKEFFDQSLFRPFRTTKKEGTGIGLFQSKMIVDAHHGKIEVESQEGRGSTFRVLFPVKE